MDIIYKHIYNAYFNNYKDGLPDFMGWLSKSEKYR